MDFNSAFEKLIGFEGNYVNDPRDPGGETRYGVSKRAYPNEDIKALTLDRAKAIYRRDYWGPAGCDAVPDALKFPLFDAAVNMGIKQAVKLLQRTVGAVDDGILGPQTLQAIGTMPADRAVARYTGHRLRFYTELAGWESFGKGWARRVAANLLEA
jgi:lysozyme family protein